MEGITAVARARLRRRWVGLVGLGLLAGIVGGMSTAAVAGERRTVTVAPRLIEATRAHDAIITVNALDEDPAVNEAKAAEIRRVIEAQPGVRAVWPLGSFVGRTSESKDWYYPLAGLERDPEIYRPILAAGRLANPEATDEVVITAQTAANTHLGVGSVIDMDFYAPSQFDAVIQGSEERPAGAQDVRLHVVGLLRDAFDISPQATARFMLATPAFARRWGPVLVKQVGFAVKLEDGTAGASRFLSNVSEELGPTAIRPQTNLAALARIASADRVARASILLLGAIIAFIGIFAVVQATRRHLTLDEDENRILEALGLTRRDRVLAATIPGLLTAAVAVGISVLVAYLLSPIFPLGRPRRLEPTPGLQFNAAVLWSGALIAAVVVVGAFATAAAVAGRDARRVPTRLPLGGLGFLTASAPPSVLLGARLALGPASGRNPIGARSIVLGASVGVVGALAAVTFAGSFHGLVSGSRNWGADFHLSMEVPSDELARATADSASPQEGITHRSRAIASDRDVDAVAVQSSATVEIDGRATPAVAFSDVKGHVRPVLRSGRAPVGDDEIALGPALARRLDVAPGDRVRVGLGGQTTSMVVVGTALDSSSVTEDYAEGALLTPSRLRRLTGAEPDLYYQVILVRFGPDADVAAATAELDRRYPWGIMDESAPALPPSLQNIEDVQAVPTLLVVFFGGLVVLALGNGLVIAGRRHRRQFGIVRSLGFTRGQVRATMASMALTLGSVSLAFGVPIGLALGVWLWSALSRQLDVATVVAWPALFVVALVPVVLLLAVLAAAWPARAANAESASAVLRSE
jgi:ABC-type lipoprotein release transport system permease subunit